MSIALPPMVSDELSEEELEQAAGGSDINKQIDKLKYLSFSTSIFK